MATRWGAGSVTLLSAGGRELGTSWTALLRSETPREELVGGSGEPEPEAGLATPEMQLPTGLLAAEARASLPYPIFLVEDDLWNLRGAQFREL